MALWKEAEKTSSSPLSNTSDTTGLDAYDAADTSAPAKSPAPPAKSERSGAKSVAESHIAPELVVEGKIEGAGHVRIAGHFKGDINVRGDLTIEKGAQVEGSVRAERVTVAGELTGNVESAEHVDLLETGALTGDVKSKTFSVAKGSKMRGQAQFGWDDASGGVTHLHKGSSDASGSGGNK